MRGKNNGSTATRNSMSNAFSIGKGGKILATLAISAVLFAGCGLKSGELSKLMIKPLRKASLIRNLTNRQATALQKL